MKRYCQYCGNELDEGERVDTRFCSDNHRIKFHNEVRRIRNLGKKAMDAIADLKAVAASNGHFKSDAQDCIRRIAMDITK